MRAPHLPQAATAPGAVAAGPSARSGAAAAGGSEPALVDNSKLVPLLWNAVRELAAETKALRRTVGRLEARLSELE